MNLAHYQDFGAFRTIHSLDYGTYVTDEEDWEPRTFGEAAMAMGTGVPEIDTDITSSRMPERRCQICHKLVTRNGRGELIHDDYLLVANDHAAV